MSVCIALEIVACTVRTLMCITLAWCRNYNEM